MLFNGRFDSTICRAKLYNVTNTRLILVCTEEFGKPYIFWID